MSSDNVDRLMSDLRVLLDGMDLTMLGDPMTSRPKRQKKRKVRHTEVRGVESGEVGFSLVMGDLLIKRDQRLLPLHSGDIEDRKKLVSQLAKQPQLLWANWVGRNGARLDFGLIVDVYLHLSEKEPIPPVNYPIGAASYYPIEHNNNSDWKGEIATVDTCDYIRPFPVGCTDY